MRSHRLAAIAAFAILLIFVLALASEHADATKGDQSLAQKKGLGALETDKKKKEGDEEGPTKTQMAIGLGSVVVAFIVIKWL